ncbi:MAG: hypothetical protein LBM98_05675, partial [Oscillospiraceae bacterium]|nr:hypothetical protein [Oscillospiraceae bacterium]
LRYVGRIGARQSSAGSVTYVSADCGTGLLRTCNALRIAGLPVLRNDGAGFALPQFPAPCPGSPRRARGGRVSNPPLRMTAGLRPALRRTAPGKPPRPCGGTPPQRG